MSDKDADMSSNDSERRQRKAKADAAGKASLAEVLSFIDDLVRKHGTVLVVKRRQKTYLDDYGRLVDDAWQSEVEYFLTNVVEEELFSHYGPRKIAEAYVEVYFVETPEESREEIGDRQRCVVIYLSKYISTLVELLDAESPTEAASEALSPTDYEHRCADALRTAGWTVRVCGASGDQGVDLVAERNGVRAVFQCKMYSSPVGNGAVQEVYTGMTFHDAKLAAVVSTAGFTPAARAVAVQTGVLLLHHSELADFPKVK